jgi:hypothetical protein
MPTPRTGSPQPGRQRRTGSRGPLLVSILTLAIVTGCAQTLAADPAATSTSPATITVGPVDDGKTVDIEVGARLVVQLQTAKRPSRFPPAWTLRSPPSKALKRIKEGSNPTQVVFVADRPGTVRLTLVKRRGCYPPLRCPLAADPSSDGTGPPLPSATATVTIRVQ